MPFVCGGHPSTDTTAKVIPALAKAGASIIEVGIPFSDPIADGPVIAAAMHEALSSGVTVKSVLESVAKARTDPASANVGLVAMVSVSIVYRVGIKRFVDDAKSAGFDGFIFPDAPLEESADFAGPVRDAGMTMSLLIAPTTPAERAAKIASACSGFVYMLARVGITGAGPQAGNLDFSELAARVSQLRNVTDLPIACGFGIASADHVRATVQQAGADAAIVGSALVKRMTDAGPKAVDVAAEMVKELALGL